MKRLFITIAAAIICAASYAQAVRIDFDYTKKIVGEAAFLDFNGNGKSENDEMVTGNIELFMKYKDFGSAGSLMDIEFSIKNEKGSMILRANYDDPILYKDGDMWFVMNKIKESLLGVTKMENGMTLIMIYDVSSYDLVKQ